MKAAVCHAYGSPGVIRVEEVAKPEPRDHELLVRVRASTVGTWDCEARSFSFPLWFWLPLRLAMGVLRPRWTVLGQELAGEVEAVGRDVEGFAPGDRVFAAVGLGFGAHAEYACVSSRRAVAHMPRNLGFAEAACLPVGGDNALHFLRLAGVRPGERVLVNGAGGNIGVLAIQIARHRGAEVTAVDAAPKLDRLREVGADHVIDYAREDFTKAGPRYDVIFDLVLKGSYSGALSALKPGGRYILANPLFRNLVRGPWTSRTSDKRVLTKFAASRPEDLVVLGELAEAGAIRGVIDRVFPLERAAAAHAYVDGGSRTGAVVLSMDDPGAGSGPSEAPW